MEKKVKSPKRKKRIPIFSGDESDDMWREINYATTVAGCRMAMYTIVCRLQELEAELFPEAD